MCVYQAVAFWVFVNTIKVLLYGCNSNLAVSAAHLYPMVLCFQKCVVVNLSFF